MTKLRYLQFYDRLSKNIYETVLLDIKKARMNRANIEFLGTYAKEPKYRSESRAAIQPVPAAVIPCLYSLS